MAALTPSDDVVTDWLSVLSGVARVQRRLDDAVEAVEVPAQWGAVLLLLFRAEDNRLPMSVLARDLSMTSGGFTKLADRVARAGLIDRRGSVDDRRVVHAALTVEGLDKARTVAARYREALREAMSTDTSEIELATAAAVLERLGAANALVEDSDQANPIVATPHDPAQPERRGRDRGGE